MIQEVTAERLFGQRSEQFKQKVHGVCIVEVLV